MRYCLLLLTVLVLAMGCKDNSKVEKTEEGSKASTAETLHQVDWLLGEWVNESDGMLSKETWSRKNENTLTGTSLRLLRKDTVFVEKMVLQQVNEDLLLTVTTIDQDNEDSVTFKLVSTKNDEFLFENRKQEFPKRIAYSNPKKDSLHAWIDGDVYGKNERIDFYFARKK